MLEDGTVVVATLGAFYEMAPDGHLARLAISPAISGPNSSIAPLPGRRFAYSTSEGVMIGELTGGGRQELPTRRAVRRWRVTLPLSRRATRAVREQRRVEGEIVVRTALPTPHGVIRESQGFPITVRG